MPFPDSPARKRAHVGNPKIHGPVSDPKPAQRPSLLLGAGHIAALWALAVAQPLFDLLGRNPDFFVARGNTAGDIIAFAFAFTLAPPALILAAEALAARVSPRARWGLHLAILGLLGAVFAMVGLKHLMTGPAGLMVALALAIGAGAALAYDRGGFLRSLLDVLVPAPLIVLGVFLLFSDSSELVLPREDVEAVQIEVGRPAPVVFLVLDEFPEGTLMTPRGTIDASRFPAFAELARSSTWYRNATAAADSTPLALPALLTGRVPDQETLPIASDQPRNIFTLLGGSYRLHVTEEATRLCPEDLCPRPDEAGEGSLSSLFSDLGVVTGHLVLPNGFRRGLPAIDQTFGGFANEAGRSDAPRFAINNPLQLVAAFNGDDDEKLFAGFLSRLDGRPRTLDFLHLQIPHYPWVHLPAGERYSNLESEFKSFFDDAGRFRAPRSVTDLALQRHLFEAGYADRLLGILIRRLKSIGAWDRTMVVVVSDHGASFTPGNFRRSVTPGNLGQMVPVPLFVRSPGQRRGRVSDRRFCTTDLLPLLARKLGVEYPWKPEACDPNRVHVTGVANLELGEGVVVARLDRVESQRADYIRRIGGLFGIGSGWGPVYGLGPQRGLLGTPVRAVPLVGTSGSAAIDDPERFRNGRISETLLRGTLDGVGPGASLAAAVNGRVVATGSAFEEEGETRFSILFPPAELRPGVNVIELYEVLEGTDRPRLALLGSAL